MNNRRILSRLFFSFLIMAACSSKVFCDDWIVAASKFEWTQNKIRGSSEESLSSLMPKLILEQISLGLSRTTSDDEMLYRTLDSYLTERQSLFLQLSKAVLARDSIVVNNASDKKVKKLIAEENKKIQEIQEKIDTNLLNTEKIRKEYEDKKNLSLQAEQKKKFDIHAISLDEIKKLFSAKEETLLSDSKNESVKFYKDDSSILFEHKEKAGYKFDKEVVAAKINGLIRGRMTVYGNYVSVSSTLSVFPGNISAGGTTEVGSIKDCLQIAKNIAEYFVPVITNNLPVEVYFDIMPETARENITITIDSDVYKKLPEKLILNTGTHNITISSEGFIQRTVSYNFINSERFMVHAELEESNPITFDLALLNPAPGSIYSDGKFAANLGPGNPGASITANNDPVIGQFKSSENDFGFFIYIPEEVQEAETQLVVRGKAVDNTDLIEKRRVWTYRAYSALVLSMPLTLFCIGKQNAVTNAYNNLAINDLDEVRKWQTINNISTAVTIGCAVFWGVELVRYLVAANNVLPKNARKAKAGEIEKSIEKTQSMAAEAKEEDVDSSEMNVMNGDMEIETAAQDVASKPE